MSDTRDRRTWYGLGGRPRLPAYLRPSGIKRTKARQSNQSLRMRISRGKRLKGLNEFKKPQFVGRMSRVTRRRKIKWWVMVAAAFAVGGAIGWLLI